MSTLYTPGWSVRSIAPKDPKDDDVKKDQKAQKDKEAAAKAQKKCTMKMGSPIVKEFTVEGCADK
eukprot:4899951-Pyramimonas_sp.AAC.1